MNFKEMMQWTTISILINPRKGHHVDLSVSLENKYLGPLEAVVAPVIKIIVDKAKSFIDGQFKLNEHMINNLEKLKITLVEIKATVDMIEDSSIADPNQKAWLLQLKDPIHDAEDLLDEFEYKMIEAEVKKKKGKLSHIASSSSNFVARAIGVDGFPKRLHKLVEKLDNMRKSATHLNNLRPREHVRTACMSTSFMPTQESEILGRNEEKQEIVNMLLKAVDSNKTSYCCKTDIFCIFGGGGVGKTTIAQLVYNDEAVMRSFDLRMWILVSDNYDFVRLTKEMLEYASINDEKKPMMDSKNLNLLQEQLRSKLQSKSVLVVLDDVCLNKERNEFQDMSDWQSFFLPLKQGSRNCNILITTRTPKVVTLLDAHPIALEGLDDDMIWFLLKKEAMGILSPPNYPELEEMGKAIAKRLRGLPLAAKAVGSLLKGKLDPVYWKEVSETNMLNGIQPILRLSYQRLPKHLKSCFAYCSIFPKDWMFDIVDLVQHWMAQGYIQSQDNDGTKAFLEGKNYFHDLLSRSFFQLIQRDSSTFYVMHDLMHDLAESVAVDECYRIEKFEFVQEIPPVRHLSIFVTNEQKLSTILAKLMKSGRIKHLRTLVIVPRVPFEFKYVLSELRSIRVLQFSGPNNLSTFDFGNLLHLRYMCIQPDWQLWKTWLLPKSMSKLYHLETLKVAGGLFLASESLHHLKKLAFVQGRPVQLYPNFRFPGWITEQWFINLETIALRDCSTCKVLPPLGDLPSLRRLEIKKLPNIKRIGHQFYGSNNNSKRVNGFPSLEELIIADMRRLREWSVMEDGALFPRLNRLCLLRCPELKSLPLLENALVPTLSSLSLCCAGPATSKINLSLDARLHQTKKITDSVSWAQLHSFYLRRIFQLSIAFCYEVMPEGGLSNVVNLKKLDIYESPNLLSSTIAEENFEEDQSHLVLPSILERLEIRLCGLTDRWLSRCLRGLANLSKLTIHKCVGLKSLPSVDVLLHLTALEWLDIHYCNELVSVESLHGLPSLKVLRITACPKLEEGGTILPPTLKSLLIADASEAGLTRYLQGVTSLSKLGIFSSTLRSTELLRPLTALRSLQIRACYKLVSLEGLDALNSLNWLAIRCCPELKSFPSEPLPASLRDIRIQGCHRELMQHLQQRRNTLFSGSHNPKFRFLV